MPDEIFEDSLLDLRARVNRAGFRTFRSKKLLHAKWSFTISEGEAEAAIAPCEKNETTDSSKISGGGRVVPMVKPGFDSYTLTIEQETWVGDERSKVVNHVAYRVWPKDVCVRAELSEGGDPAVGFQYRVQQGGVELEQATLVAAPQTGETQRKTPLTSCGPVEIIPVSPWVIDTRKTPAKGREWKLAVTKKPWKAKLRSHEGGKSESAPHKQYVNLQTNYAEGHGSLVELVLGPEDLQLATRGQTIKVRASFPASNCRRESPLPGLWKTAEASSALKPKKTTAKPGVDELVYETEVAIPTDNQPARLYLHMGVAGGDRCKVEVGVTDTREDDVLHVQNMRKIELEVLTPISALRQASDLLDESGAIAPEVLAELNRVYADAWIELECPSDACKTVALEDFKHGWDPDKDEIVKINLTKPEALFPPAKFVAERRSVNGRVEVAKSSSSGKLALLSYGTALYLREEQLGGTPAGNRTTWTFCDRIPRRSGKNRRGGGRNGFVCRIEPGETKAVRELPFHVFDYDPIRADGQLGVHSLRWRVTNYRPKEFTNWYDAEMKHSPEIYKRHAKWTTVGPFESLEARNEWVRLTNSLTVEVTPPKTVTRLLEVSEGEDEDGDPYEYEAQIDIDLICNGVEFSVLGSAKEGVGMFRLDGRNVLGLARTIAHEIGHNLGQGYTAKQQGVTGGRAKAIPGMPFAPKWPEGNYYVGMGHTGGHCAQHLRELMANERYEMRRRDLARERNFEAPVFARWLHRDPRYYSGVCVMYGSGDAAPTTARDFCDSCISAITATDASDVRKDWTA